MLGRQTVSDEGQGFSQVLLQHSSTHEELLLGQIVICDAGYMHTPLLASIMS
jgi:hypothetical protein